MLPCGVLRFARVSPYLVRSTRAAVAAEESSAGELVDLFADQALFVEAVAEAFGDGGRVEGKRVAAFTMKAFCLQMQWATFWHW